MRGLTTRWLGLVLILAVAGCFDDLSVSEAEHPCAKCRACETCVGVVDGEAVCESESRARQACGDDGNGYWVNGCGDQEEFLVECARPAIGCIETKPGKVACQCPAGRVGATCQDCAARFDPASGCEACAAHWTGEECDLCPGHWDADANCNQCQPHWGGDDCNKCTAHWTGEECDTCPEPWDPETDCASVCGDGKLEPDEACDDAVHAAFCNNCIITKFSLRDGAVSAADVALRSDGSAVYVWARPSNDSDGSTIEGRIVAVDGTLAVPFQVNTNPDVYNRDPQVAVASDDSFAVAWTGGSSLSTYTQWFDADGARLGDRYAGSSYSDFASAMLASDQLVVASVHRFISGNQSHVEIFGQRIDKDGYVASDSIYDEILAGANSIAVAAGSGGDYTAVWFTDANPDDSRFPIVGAVRSGSQASLTFSIGYAGDEVSLHAPVIAYLTEDSFVVAWTAGYDDPSGSSSTRLNLQAFSATAQPKGYRRQAAASTAMNDDLALLCGNGDGFVVGWVENDDSVMVQRFDKDIEALGEPRFVDKGWFSRVEKVSMACGADGSLAFAWSDTAGAHGQRVSRDDQPIGLFPW